MTPQGRPNNPQPGQQLNRRKEEQYQAQKEIHHTTVCHSDAYKEEKFHAKVTIEGGLCKMELDTGSYFTIVSWQTIKKLNPTASKKLLKPPNVQLNDYLGNQIQVLGRMEVKVVFHKFQCCLSLMVIASHRPSLLRVEWFKPLGLDITCLHQISIHNLYWLLAEFTDVFNGGLGCSWAAAALLLLFGARAFPIGDSSGEEEFGEDPSSRTSAAGRVQLNVPTELALWLQGTAATWNQEEDTHHTATDITLLRNGKLQFVNNVAYTYICEADYHCANEDFGPPAINYIFIFYQLCKEQNACKGTMEIMAQNNLNLPKIIKEDGCYQPGFQKESCLRKLSSGLYTFRTFLEYIEETTQRSVSVSIGAQNLAETLKSMMNNPETVSMPSPDAQKTLAAKLREQRAWNIIVIKHFILQDFTLFMETTSRVIRLL
ncbi:PREDICTED: interleukin-6 [Thamnophis sirtalis]|uniref:Interleukin-6 n=1 Tax=Thamnophis sirtalis TaxID=35019 RepID=A0A6I9X4B1_9SAUR|nr:PREDICTED: interleukin-6 [Thamnophis sirtalis]